MLKSFIVTALALAASVFAELSINNPVAGTVWSSGQNQVVSWVSSDGTPLTGQVSIALLQGNDPNNLATLTTLGSNINASLGSFTIQVPPNLASTAYYAVSVTDASGIHYSHYFSINGVAGGITALTASPTTTTSPSSVASSSTTAANSQTGAQITTGINNGATLTRGPNNNNNNNNNASTFKSNAEIVSGSKVTGGSHTHLINTSEFETSNSDESSEIESSESESGSSSGAVSYFGIGLSASLFALCVAQLY